MISVVKNRSGRKREKKRAKTRSTAVWRNTQRFLAWRKRGKGGGCNIRNAKIGFSHAQAVTPRRNVAQEQETM